MLSEGQYITLLLRSVKRGSIITLKGDTPYESDHDHHFVILNYDPQAGEYLVTVSHTSQVATSLTHLSKRPNTDVNATTVVFAPGEYNFFPKQTLFDCNQVFEITPAELARAYAAGNLSIPHQSIVLRDEDLDKLANAALKSRSVPKINKKKIDPNFS